ncbi:hypothetical protein ACFFX0_24040 [Citricoccus parietis]|uniref:Uncharacterized protein n=1 Tax=Citricoccus parietis TaxID=592307 RepID=A0ABV5G576_9MICC
METHLLPFPCGPTHSCRCLYWRGCYPPRGASTSPAPVSVPFRAVGRWADRHRAAQRTPWLLRIGPDGRVTTGAFLYRPSEDWNTS